MGGNALKQFGAKRLENSRFEAFAFKLNNIMNDILASHGVKTKARLIPSYHDKPDHGDIDIVVPMSATEVLTNEQMMEELSSRFEVGPMPFKKNGPVVSYGYPLEEGGVFQIDLIYTKESELDFSVSYFSWNDVGNLVGRIAHKMGLKFGHDGLSLPLRDGTHEFATIMITQDFKAALEFLGFSYERWAQGFSNLEEIFNFTVANPRFNSAIYLLENRNHTARVRDKKRPTYTKLLEWLEDHPEVDKAFEWSEDKSVWIPVILEAFPNAKADYEQALKNLERQRALKVKFNGDIVSEATGLEGKDLGIFVADFKKSFESKEAFNQFIEENDEVTIKEKILAHKA